MGVRTDVKVGYSTGTPTDQYVFMRSAAYKGDGTRTGIIWGHSATAPACSASFPTTGISQYVPRIMRWLAECGWPIICADLGGDPVGNDTGIALYEDCRTYLQGTLGAKAGKVIVAGWSEGGINGMNYTRAHPANVAAQIYFEPGGDLQDVVTNNRGGFASVINAAYSGGYSDAVYGANHSPVMFASQLAGIPTHIDYASDDPVAIPAANQTVIAGIGASCTVGLVSTGGHGDGFLSKLVDADGTYGTLSRWLWANVGA